MVPSSCCFELFISAQFLRLNTEHHAVHWKTWIENKNHSKKKAVNAMNKRFTSTRITEINNQKHFYFRQINKKAFANLDSFDHWTSRPTLDLARDILVGNGPWKGVWLSSSVPLKTRRPADCATFEPLIWFSIVVDSFSFSYDFQLKVEIIRMTASVWHDCAECRTRKIMFTRWSKFATTDFVDRVVYML